jgi:hypothetical protein
MSPINTNLLSIEDQTALQTFEKARTGSKPDKNMFLVVRGKGDNKHLECVHKNWFGRLLMKIGFKDTLTDTMNFVVIKNFAILKQQLDKIDKTICNNEQKYVEIIKNHNFDAFAEEVFKTSPTAAKVLFVWMFLHRKTTIFTKEIEVREKLKKEYSLPDESFKDEIIKCKKKIEDMPAEIEKLRDKARKENLSFHEFLNKTPLNNEI